MKKRFVSLVFCFISFSLFSVFAKGIYLSPKIELKNGTVKEYVFDGEHKLSQLDWQVENQVSFGFDAEFNFDKIYLGFDFSYGFYNFDGNMEDWDWENYTTPNIHTKYSHHDLIVNNDLDCSLEFGFLFPFENKSFGKLILGVNLQNTNFSGWNGWYEYKNYYPPKDNLSGLIITYNPYIVSYFVGFGGTTYISKKVYFNLELIFGLYSFGKCVDNHVLTKTQFVDYVNGTTSVNTELAFGYDFSNNTSIILGGKLENSPLLCGSSYANGKQLTSQGGFSSFFYEFYLSYRIRIL